MSDHILAQLQSHIASNDRENVYNIMAHLVSQRDILTNQVATNEQSLETSRHILAQLKDQSRQVQSESALLHKNICITIKELKTRQVELRAIEEERSRSIALLNQQAQFMKVMQAQLCRDVTLQAGLQEIDQLLDNEQFIESNVDGTASMREKVTFLRTFYQPPWDASILDIPQGELCDQPKCNGSSCCSRSDDIKCTRMRRRLLLVYSVDKLLIRRNMNPDISGKWHNICEIVNRVLNK